MRAGKAACDHWPDMKKQICQTRDEYLQISTNREKSDVGKVMPVEEGGEAAEIDVYGKEVNWR